MTAASASVVSRPNFRPVPPFIRRRRELEILRAAQHVAAFYAVPFEAVRSPTRNNPARAKVRQVICYFAHEVLRRSYPDIARALNYADHTTPLHGKQAVASRILAEPEFAAEITRVTDHVCLSTRGL